MARGLEKAQYTADDGKVYTAHIKKNTVAQAILGWTAGIGADGSLPKRFRMRQVHGVDATGFRRSVFVGDPTATAYTTPGSVFTLDSDDAATVDYTRTGRTGERQTD